MGRQQFRDRQRVKCFQTHPSVSGGSSIKVGRCGTYSAERKCIWFTGDTEVSEQLHCFLNLSLPELLLEDLREKNGWYSREEAEKKMASKGLAICVGNTYRDPSFPCSTPLHGDKAAESFRAMFRGWGWDTELLIDEAGGRSLSDKVESIIHTYCTAKTDYTAIFFTFNGHGDGTGVLGNDLQFTTYEALQDKLDSRLVVGKPKVMILDCCQGGHETGFHAQSAASMPKITPKGADFLIGYPSGKGTVSWGDCSGGIYTQQVIEILSSQSPGKIKLVESFFLINQIMQTRPQHAVAANFNVSFTEEKII